MTLLYLVRHAAHARQDDGTLVGRAPGIGLGAAAPAQLRWLADRLAGIGFAAVLSSPRERAIETARAVAGEPVPMPELDEIDFGAWTGRRIDDLADDPTWRNWNSFRSATRIPAGENMLAVQARAVGLTQRACLEHPSRSVLLVSHAEVLRAVIMHHLGLPMDLWARIELEPGSLSVVEVLPWGTRLVRLNETATRV